MKLRHLDVFDPIHTWLRIRQKTVKHTPADRLYDAWIRLLAVAYGLVEINARLRTDPALRDLPLAEVCAEQSVVQETVDACTTENGIQLRASAQ